MAIVSCTQIGAGRNGQGKSDFHRSYTVVWQVIVNSAYDGAMTIGLYAALPARFAPYVGYENAADIYALCTDLRIEQDGGDWQKWRVTATFDTNWQNGQKNEENPEDEPSLFWVETEFVNKKVTKDGAGNPIVNAAGQLIAGLERIDAVETWVWEKNTTYLNRSLWKQYQNAVNSDSFYELDPKEGLMHIIVPKASYRNGVPFYRVQYRVKVNKDKWTQNPANIGTMVKGSDGKLHPPVDSTGQNMSGAEVYLKVDGSQITDFAATPINYIGEKDMYPLKPFSGLGL